MGRFLCFFCPRARFSLLCESPCSGAMPAAASLLMWRDRCPTLGLKDGAAHLPLGQFTAPGRLAVADHRCLASCRPVGGREPGTGFERAEAGGHLTHARQKRLFGLSMISELAQRPDTGPAGCAGSSWVFVSGGTKRSRVCCAKRSP